MTGKAAIALVSVIWFALMVFLMPQASTLVYLYEVSFNIRPDSIPIEHVAELVNPVN